NCPEPDAEAVQYVCTGEAAALGDLDVTGSGTVEWYEDSAGTNSIPSSTNVANGEVYDVTNTDAGCSESGPIAIKVYEQSVEFVVSPSSCVDLGANVFFVEEGDLNSHIDIEVNNLDGDPFEEEIIWGSNIPFADVGYYFQGGGPYYPMVSTLGPGNPIIHIEFTPDLYDVVEFDLDIHVVDGCSPSQ